MEYRRHPDNLIRKTLKPIKMEHYMTTIIEISKQLDHLKIRNFVDAKKAILRKREIMIEILFPRYTDIDKAIAFFNKKEIEHSGRENNKHMNAYYKFKTEIYIKL